MRINARNNNPVQVNGEPLKNVNNFHTWEALLQNQKALKKI
jgi:hypothetical protein